MNTNPLPFRFPNSETIPALVLALKLKGRKVSTLSMTYSPIHATRLPAYIDQLRGFGFGDEIVARDLPLTPQQAKRRYSKPFSVYHLKPSVIDLLGEKAQRWAQEILDYWDVNVEEFPFSDDWLAYQRGER